MEKAKKIKVAFKLSTIIYLSMTSYFTIAGHYYQAAFTLAFTLVLISELIDLRKVRVYSGSSSLSYNEVYRVMSCWARNKEYKTIADWKDIKDFYDVIHVLEV